MRVYRIAKTGYISDLSGNGSRTYGGRWSPPGIPVVYTSQSRSLAALEFYVHTSPRFMPSDIRIAEIDVPDSVRISSVAMSDLPADWYHYPAPIALKEYGLKWFTSGKSLILRVPSVQVKHEYNFLINPLHPDMRGVKILNVDIFLYDERLTTR